MTTARPQRPRGAALVTAMLLTMLLLTLGIGFLSFCQRDLRFQRRQQESREAQNLARAGVEYYRYLDTKDPPESPASGSKIVVQVVPDEEEFEIERLAGRAFVSRGRVLKNGQIAVERSIVVPQGTLMATSRTYDRDL